MSCEKKNERKKKKTYKNIFSQFPFSMCIYVCLYTVYPCVWQQTLYKRLMCYSEYGIFYTHRFFFFLLTYDLTSTMLVNDIKRKRKTSEICLKKTTLLLKGNMNVFNFLFFSVLFLFPLRSHEKNKINDKVGS